MSRSKKDEGFTLIELMIAIVCMGLIFMLIASMWTVVVKSTDIAEDNLDASVDIQMITTRFADDVQGALTDVPGSGAVVTFKGTGFDVALNPVPWEHIYRLNGTKLTRDGGLLARSVCTAVYSPAARTLTLTFMKDSTCPPGLPATVITGTKRVG